MERQRTHRARLARLMALAFVFGIAPAATVRSTARTTTFNAVSAPAKRPTATTRSAFASTPRVSVSRPVPTGGAEPAEASNQPQRSDLLPPVGATYIRTLVLPVIGLQTIKLTVATPSKARLQLTGAISVTDSLDYGLDRAGRLFFRLRPRLQGVLRSLGFSVDEAKYERSQDSAYVTLRAGALPAVRISLQRLHPPPRRVAPAEAGAAPSPEGAIGQPPRESYLESYESGAEATPAAVDEAAADGNQATVPGEADAEGDKQLTDGLMRMLELAQQRAQRDVGIVLQWGTPATAPADAPSDAEEVTEAAAVDVDATVAVAEPGPAPVAATPPQPARDPRLPRVGAKYERTLRLPVIGMQTVRLTMTSEEEAFIELDGYVKVSDPLKYWMGPRGLDFELSTRTQQILKAMSVSLTSTEYNPRTDVAAVTIKPPAVPAIRIELFAAPATK